MPKKSHKEYQEMSIHQKSTTFNVIKREIMRDKIALGSFIFIVAVIMIIIIAAFIVDIDRESLQRSYGFLYPERLNRAPSRHHLLGTDTRGRDGVMLLVAAARNSLIVTALATLISSAFGIIYGLVSGYAGGRVDRYMMGVIDGISVVPNLIILITLLGLLGGFSMFTYTVMLSLLAWTGVAKMIRTRLIQEKEFEYIEASKTLGTSNIKIIFYHLLPNLSTIIIASMTLNAVAIIGMETGLSFLNFGFPTDMPSLGTLVATAGDMRILRFRWWIWMPATVLIVLIMFSINCIGNTLSRAADARQRRG